MQVTLWNGRTAWVVSHLADQRALLADPRISADDHHPNYPFVNAALQAARSSRTFLGMDGNEHIEHRRHFLPAFSARRMRRIAPRIEAITGAVLDAMEHAEAPCDLVGAFALPVPARTICELLGVPYADFGFFEAVCSRITDANTDPEAARTESLAIIGRLADLPPRATRPAHPLSHRDSTPTS